MSLETRTPELSRGRMPSRGIAIWIVLCALLNCAGWILSALHQLNRGGYLVVFLLMGVGLFLFCRSTIRANFHCGVTPRKYRRRFKRAFPFAFLILATMALVGGIIYAPTNYDALAYRLPRILHWLEEGQWHWIHTEFQRLNTRATGFEWIATPIVLFTKTDRFIFLINAVSFLFLPGLIFSAFTRLGIRPRVAWHWMWIIPAGYCFLLQAGSIANDLFGAVFALAAVDFALRARAAKDDSSSVWCSVLAAALLTGSKASNIPLLLPWLIAIFPAVLPAIKRQPLMTILAGIAAILSSLLPISALNIKYCGDWSGESTEKAVFNGNPIVCLAGNSLLLPVQNLVPPIFPIANTWNQIERKFMPRRWNEVLEKNFEPGGAHFSVGEMQVEESAGLGFGVTLLLLASMGSLKFLPARRNDDATRNGIAPFLGIMILLSPYAALSVFMVKSGLSGGARLITPYYALLIPLLLVHHSHGMLIRQAWWRWLAFIVVFILSGILLIVQPARPLWPARALLTLHGSSNPLIRRADAVYAGYRERSQAFAPALALFPGDADVLGLIAFDDPEGSLWKPFGKRQIVHVTRQDSAESLDHLHIRYVLVNTDYFHAHFGQTFDPWLVSHHGVILKKFPLLLKVSNGSEEWLLVDLQPGQRKAL